MNPSGIPIYHPDIEVIHPDIERGRVRYALFDFDGTLSLIREGWQGVMIPMMVEILMETPEHESEAEIYTMVKGFVDRLTGKQTIYQMMQLCEEVLRRNGEPLSPLEYKWLYLDRLGRHIEERIAGLKFGAIQSVDLMVPGSLQILEALRQRGVTCFLASGTDEAFVIDEANALGLSEYFAGIYGAVDDYQNFSKKMVIERILKENQLHGNELVTFGDGYVEIEDTRTAGGIAVGVATNEADKKGVDEWKRQRLIDAGADLIIPDFRPYKQLVNYLFKDD